MRSSKSKAQSLKLQFEPQDPIYKNQVRFTQIITKANSHISYIKYHQQKTNLPSMFHLLPNQQHALNQQPN
jgi:hypothetical protein